MHRQLLIETGIQRNLRLGNRRATSRLEFEDSASNGAVGRREGAAGAVSWRLLRLTLGITWGLFKMQILNLRVWVGPEIFPEAASDPCWPSAF